MPVALSPVMRGRARDWLRRRLRALSALTRRISCGELPDKPAGEAGGPRLAVRMGVDGAATRAAVPLARLPRGFGWMCAFGPKVQADGAAFAAWLGEPAMRAMMAAAPESMARVVGPILTATGQPTPEWFPRRAKRVKHNSVACGEKPEREADDPHSGKVVVPVIESRGCASLPAPPQGEGRIVSTRNVRSRCDVGTPSGGVRHHRSVAGRFSDSPALRAGYASNLIKENLAWLDTRDQIVAIPKRNQPLMRPALDSAATISRRVNRRDARCRRRCAAARA